MKNSADQGGCYPQRPNISSLLKEFRHYALFFRSPNITQFCPQVFSVNGSIICSGLHFWRHFNVIGSINFGGMQFWRHWFNMAKILSKFGEQQLVMVNYGCGFNQSETGKYFEWIIMEVLVVQYSTHNRPRLIYQYSNKAPRLSGQTSIFGVVLFVSKSLLGMERQNELKKNYYFDPKASEPCWNIDRTWFIGCMGVCKNRSTVTSQVNNHMIWIAWKPACKHVGRLLRFAIVSFPFC